MLGDANLDGAVDVSDLNAWLSHNNQLESRWSRGDFDASGFVDVNDFNVWNLYKFQTGSLPVSKLPTSYLMSHQDPLIKPFGEGSELPLGHNEQGEKFHRVGTKSHGGGCCCGDCRSHQFATDEVFAQPHQREIIQADRTVIHSIDAKLSATAKMSVDPQSAADRLTNPMAKDYRDDMPLGRSRSLRPAPCDIESYAR